MTKKPSDVGSENYNRVMDGLEEIARGQLERKRSDMTLRERVLDVIGRRVETAFDLESDMRDLIFILEDTGSPAHMRVAAELRGK